MTIHITINVADGKTVKRDMIIIDDMIYLDNPVFTSPTVKKMFGMKLEMFIEDVEKNLESIIRMRELHFFKHREVEIFTGERFDMVHRALEQEIKELECYEGVDIVTFDA